MSRAAHTTTSLTRREFLELGGGLLIAMALPEAALAQQGSKPPRAPQAFVHIGGDDVITIVSPAVEMGQGGHTAMPMILMEELGGDWAKLKVVDAPPEAVYNNPVFGSQSTVGSFSVRGWYAELRRVGAAAREMLVESAAEVWGVPAAECSVKAGRITHGSSGRSVSFGTVAPQAAKRPVPSDPKIKANGAFEIIGTSPPRVDIVDKVDGSARFGIDAQVENLTYAAVKACPSLGGTLKSFDDAKARGMPGFIASVGLTDAVAVVADSYWHAQKALAQVQAEFEPGKLKGMDSAQVSKILRAAVDEPGTTVRNDGDAAAALAACQDKLDATYEVPYLAHACMEPMNCTVRIDATGCDVWCGTQAPQWAQQAAAKALGLPPEQVRVHTLYLGGGFGRRGEADFVTQAAQVAKQVGRPVKLIWSREEDIQHDFYRPAAAIRFRAGFDAKKALVALESNVVTASAPARITGAAFYTGGIADANYLFKNYKVTGINKDIGVRFGFWRSVNDSHNPFMLEGFIDEIARHVGEDPYRLRRSLLQGERGRRQLAMLDALAEKVNWPHAAPGRHFGIAACFAYGSYIGTVVDASVQGKQVTVHRVVQAVDCGVAVHPDNIRAQLEGGMVYGLTAVLKGEITLQDGAVMQKNFSDYPLLSMREMPLVECIIVPSTAPPGGIGEPGTATIAPALANAIYAATGERIRTLPLSRHGFSFAVRRA